MREECMHIAVVGGGVVGMTAAYELNRRGPLGRSRDCI